MKRLSWAYGSRGIVLRTLATRLLRVADRQRWGDLGNHDEAWDTRTREIAQFIPPRAHVVEFGAGRCALRRWLPANCTYVPSDIVSRGADTWLCDLNRRPLPPLLRSGTPQVAVFSGVLEYVVDVFAVATWLRPHTDRIVASYNCAPQTSSPLGRLRSATARLRAGWVNAFTGAELGAVFERAGFKLVAKRTVPGQRDEVLFVFQRRGLA